MIVLFCLALESLTWAQATELVALFAVCFCIRILGVTILALHIGTGVGLRSLVVALQEIFS